MQLHMIAWMPLTIMAWHSPQPVGNLISGCFYEYRVNNCSHTGASLHISHSIT